MNDATPLTDTTPVTDASSAVQQAFHDLTGATPTGVWFAPGRVNLIGEHTDYNDGFCMPFALPHRVLVAASVREDQHWQVRALDMGQTIEFGADELAPGAHSGWAGYVAGVVWAMREAGHPVPGADLVLSSNVPIGAGLSSSAALECAVLTALADLADLDIDLMDRAVLARRAENVYVGAPTGLMDQAASTLCREGHALFFDCRALTVEQVPFAPGDHGLDMLVLDTRTPHSHVDGEYAERRASCEKAATILGVAALRDVTLDQLDRALQTVADPLLQRRVRHVVTEDARVLAAVDALRQGDLTTVGSLLNESHTSMREDFEITVPTVDVAVETARAHGAIGARMTGGGFGGCIIALVPVGTSDLVAQAISDAFAERGWAAPAWFIATPSHGAGRLR